MSYRRHTAKPSVALWMLVAVGDVLLILTRVGMLALVALIGVTLATAAGVRFTRRSATANRDVAARTARHRVSA